MVRKAWYFVTLVLAALLMGTTFGHLLEMPVKLEVDGPLWLTFQHTLYRYFAIAGAPIELGAILAAAGLAFFVRENRRVFYPVLAGAVCLAAAFLVVWLWRVNPVNARTAAWTADALPADWAAWRARWEYGHAIRFGLHLAGFCALLVALLLEVPAQRLRTRRP